jgi:hypothetical protein
MKQTREEQPGSAHPRQTECLPTIIKYLIRNCVYTKPSSQLVLNFPGEFVRGIRWRFGFIDAGVKYIRHYLPHLVTYAASDVQPVEFCAINLAAPYSAPKLQTEM